MKNLRRASDGELYCSETSRVQFTLSVVNSDYNEYTWVGTLVDLRDSKVIFHEVFFGQGYTLNQEIRVAQTMLLTSTSTVDAIKNNPALLAAVMYMVSEM